MNLHTFICRPILSGVLSVFIVLLGGIGLVLLPVEQFPEFLRHVGQHADALRFGARHRYGGR